MDGLKGTLCEKPWFLALNVWALQICLKNLKALLGWRKLQCNQVAVWLSGSLGSGADVGLKKSSMRLKSHPLKAKLWAFGLEDDILLEMTVVGFPSREDPLIIKSPHHSLTNIQPNHQKIILEHHQIIQYYPTACWYHHNDSKSTSTFWWFS